MFEKKFHNAYHFDEYFRLVNYDAVNMAVPYYQVEPINKTNVKALATTEKEEEINTKK